MAQHSRICNDLRWDAHVDALCSKVASRLYFLKLLKRSGLSDDNLLCFYKSVLFWSIVQLYGIITSHLLKVINSRPCKTCCLHNSLPSYSTIHWILGYLKLESLKHRRTEADKKFFSRISQPDNCLYHLLPPPRDTKLITKLRYANKYPVPLTKTKRFCSFINFAIANYVD